jgi:error-prone DNA polymerase
MDYVELHCHSNFSFLDGANDSEDLAEEAFKLGYKALALTDHNGLYGIVRFHKACKERGIKAIIGSEITLENGHHLVLIVKDQRGYSNLCQLLTQTLLSHPKAEAKIKYEELFFGSEGLIALSGCLLGEIPSLLLKKDSKSAEEVALKLKEVFGKDNFFLELQYHNTPEQAVVNSHLINLSKKLNIPLVVTNNVHYIGPEGRRLQDVLVCIKNHTNLDQAGTLLYPNAERHLKNPQEIKRILLKYSEAIENTLRIADTCDFSLDSLIPSLPAFSVPQGETPFSYLYHLTYEGAKEKYKPMTPEAAKQIAHELDIIQKLDLAGYFLIVWDIARFCRERSILCQGRGSAANSAVCYCLGITAVDPVKLNLLFERFLSEERKEPPDIDIDIQHNRREEVIQYVYQKYGRKHAGMVCEVITYRGRSSVRDVGKALGFSLEQVDRLAKLLDHYSDNEEIIERVKESGLNLDSKRVKLLVEPCKEIENFPRHLGIHNGGMVITARPLSEIVPIENATMSDRTVIQWDKDDAGDVGLVKIDLLGLGMLTLIDYAIKLVTEHKGIVVDPAQLSYDDSKVYDLLCNADTVGVFQVESRAQMNTLPRLKPRCFYDLVIEVALIRPGPIQGEMVHPYLRRRNSEEPITYPHPCLESILKRTLGVPLFQEQGMKVAMQAAGFTASQADELRRAMGHKRSKEKMENLSVSLIQGMVKNGIDLLSASQIYKQLAAFADFGFAESHAASFALLVYVSAYFKVYYPSEFYCALLNAQPLGFYNPCTIVEDAKRHGVEILSVDITKSQWDCTLEGEKVRLGFRYVRDLGPSAKEKIEKEQAKSPFESLEDFVFRTNLPQPALEQLAMVDAFSCFGLDRREALWRVKGLANKSEEEFSLKNSPSAKVTLPLMNPSEILVADYDGLGLSPTSHPMRFLRNYLNKMDVKCACDLPSANGHKIKVAGLVIVRQRPGTAKGFVFLTLEDETGLVNVVVKPNLVKKCRKAIISSSILLVQGNLEKHEGVINIIGEEFSPLEFPQGGVKFESRDFR